MTQWLEHRSAVSEGLRFDSSWGLRIFSLSHARGKTNKNLSLHFDFFPVSQNKQVIFYSYYIKLILLVRSRQLDISIVPFFCVFLNFDLSQSMKTQKRKKKKKLCQYPAIWTSRLVNTHIYQKWIKRLLEPAHSCYGLSLHWFLGLAEYRYSWIRFMWTFKTFGINFLLFLGSCVIRKVVHLSWWKLEKGWCGVEVGWAEVIRQCPFRWCVYVCGAGSSCKPIKI